MKCVILSPLVIVIIRDVKRPKKSDWAFCKVCAELRERRRNAQTQLQAESVKRDIEAHRKRHIGERKMFELKRQYASDHPHNTTLQFRLSVLSISVQSSVIYFFICHIGQKVAI